MLECVVKCALPWVAATGETGGGGPVLANFPEFNIMPMGVAWKESTSNGSRPHPRNRRAAAHSVFFYV